MQARIQNATTSESFISLEIACFLFEHQQQQQQVSHLDPYGSVIHDLHIYHSTPCLPPMHKRCF